MNGLAWGYLDLGNRSVKLRAPASRPLLKRGPKSDEMVPAFGTSSGMAETIRIVATATFWNKLFHGALAGFALGLEKWDGPTLVVARVTIFVTRQGQSRIRLALSRRPAGATQKLRRLPYRLVRFSRIQSMLIHVPIRVPSNAEACEISPKPLLHAGKSFPL
jgi:hypothetical protein